MSDFEYLSVLVSIILGLGITNILGGFGAIVRNRHRTRLYMPVLVTMFTMFLIHVQTWWTMFGLRDIPHWTIVEFFVVLAQPTFLYLASAMLVPDFSSEGEVDLRAQYRRERVWFFGSMLVLILISLLRPVILAGKLTGTADLVGHGVFLAAVITGLVTENDRAHKIVAPFILAFFLIYIAALFVQLT